MVSNGHGFWRQPWLQLAPLEAAVSLPVFVPWNDGILLLSCPLPRDAHHLARDAHPLARDAHLPPDAQAPTSTAMVPSASAKAAISAISAIVEDEDDVTRQEHAGYTGAILPRPRQSTLPVGGGTKVVVFYVGDPANGVTEGWYEGVVIAARPAAGAGGRDGKMSSRNMDVDDGADVPSSDVNSRGQCERHTDCMRGYKHGGHGGHCRLRPIVATSHTSGDGGSSRGGSRGHLSGSTMSVRFDDGIYPIDLTRETYGRFGMWVMPDESRSNETWAAAKHRLIDRVCHIDGRDATVLMCNQFGRFAARSHDEEEEYELSLAEADAAVDAYDALWPHRQRGQSSAGEVAGGGGVTVPPPLMLAHGRAQGKLQSLRDLADSMTTLVQQILSESSLHGVRNTKQTC